MASLEGPGRGIGAFVCRQWGTMASVGAEKRFRMTDLATSCKTDGRESAEAYRQKDRLGGSCCLPSWPEFVRVKERGRPTNLGCLCTIITGQQGNIRFLCRGVGTKLGVVFITIHEVQGQLI